MSHETPTTIRSQVFEQSENVGRNATINATLGELIAARHHRRDLLKGALAVTAIAATLGPAALAAASRRARAAGAGASFAFAEIPVSTGPDIQVAPGYKADVLIRWGDPVLPGAPIFDPLAQSAPAQRLQFGPGERRLLPLARRAEIRG